MNIVMMQDKGLTDRLFKPEHLERLRRLGTLRVFEGFDRLTAEDAEAIIEGADIIINTWGSPRLEAGLLDRCPDLKLVAYAAGSVKPVLSPAVQERGIRVCSANDALAQGVAETALGLAIVSLKNIWQLSRDTRAGEWEPNNKSIRELYGLNIGIIGAGLSGRHLIRLLKQFDVRVLVYDPYLSEEAVSELGAEKVELDELLKQSDVVSIHAPSIPETKHLMNERTLRLMKDDAILINTARGSLIDEDALVAELRLGRLWACLDVTEPEPPALDHPFRTLPNVTLIPHIAGAVNNGLFRIGGYITRELELFAQGERLQGEVDLSALHRLA